MPLTDAQRLLRLKLIQLEKEELMLQIQSIEDHSPQPSNLSVRTSSAVVVSHSVPVPVANEESPGQSINQSQSISQSVNGSESNNQSHSNNQYQTINQSESTNQSEPTNQTQSISQSQQCKQSQPLNQSKSTNQSQSSKRKTTRQPKRVAACFVLAKCEEPSRTRFDGQEQSWRSI